MALKMSCLFTLPILDMLSLDFFKRCPTLPKQESQFINNIGNQNQIREIMTLYDILSYTN